MSKGTIARLGSLLVIVGLAVISAVVLTAVPVLLAAAGWVVAGLGAGIGFTTNSIAVLDDAAGSVGSASSQMELGNQAGIAIGTGSPARWSPPPAPRRPAWPGSSRWPGSARCSPSWSPRGSPPPRSTEGHVAETWHPMTCQQERSQKP